MKFKRIKDLREDHDKFQKDIAQLLGISQQYYSKYEKGNRTIPMKKYTKKTRETLYKVSLVLFLF